MTKRDIIDLLAKWDFKAQVQEDDYGIIRIITDRPIPEHLKDTVKASVPVSVMVVFSVTEVKKIVVPKILEKWWLDTQKYLPKDKNAQN